MKQIFFTSIVFFCFLFSCTEKLTDEVQLVDLKEHNMKLLPLNPTANDEIRLVIFDDCTYNVLSGVSRRGNTIDISKQFNSMMKWPCVMQNDTILIGKLSAGNYTLNYKLVDISTQSSQPIVLSLSFNLVVSK